MHFMSLVFAICLNFSLSAFANNHANIWREKALDIKLLTETQVDHEMTLLFSRWATMAPKDPDEINKLISTVDEKIQADKQSLAQMLSSIKSLPPIQREEVGLDLSSNAQKFSGTFSDHILTKLNEEYLNIIKGEKIALSRVQLTEVKMLLLYLIGIKEKARDVTKTSVYNEIQFLYNYKLEAFIDLTRVQSHFLLSAGTFYMPNSGYVFGGTLRDGINRGMDCSAYITMVLGANFRPSSLLLEVLWNRQMNVPMPYFDTYPEKLEELISNWSLLDLEDEFEALNVRSSADLQAGDVVVWRTSSAVQADIFAKSGHVLMVLDPGPGANKFSGIDLRRDEDQEGHYQDVYQLFLPGKETFVVRKRTP